MPPAKASRKKPSPKKGSTRPSGKKMPKPAGRSPRGWQPTAAILATYGSEADAILEECRAEVGSGLGGKTLQPAADRILRAFFKPKILRRLSKGGNWKKEKKHPLIVAYHLGQIAAIMSKGPTVTAAVARAAAVAVQNDEICPRGGGGAGQWCF
jgi:hypothetical protein